MPPGRRQGYFLPVIGGIVLTVFVASSVYALVQGEVGSALTGLLVIAVLLAAGTGMAALTGLRRR
jgi:hypothetical protein